MKINPNSKKSIGFDYAPVDMKRAGKEVIRKARTEQITLSNEGKYWTAISAACPEVYYKLDLLCDNTGFCTCPAFTYRKGSTPCKHLVALDRHIEQQHSQRQITAAAPQQPMKAPEPVTQANGWKAGEYQAFLDACKPDY